MKEQHIVMNRYTGKPEPEPLEWGLRFFYHTPAGRFFLAWGARQYWQSKLYGRYSLSRWSRKKAYKLIKRHQLDPSDWEVPPGGFVSFNDFFTRRLKPGARPLPEDPKAVVFPADARHWAYPELTGSETFEIKGERFYLKGLLQDATLARRYEGGAAIFSRLCPTDYHRFHFPASGVPHAARLVEGRLHSVHPIGPLHPRVCAHRNRRQVTCIEVPSLGLVTMVEIGALLVGSIQQTFKALHNVNQGDEKGYFQFGGSAILTLFEPQALRLSPDLLEANAQGLELYAHVNDTLGTRL